MERVVVTGMGTITPCGLDVRSTWEALVAGKSGGGPITLFDCSTFAVKIACEVKGWEPTRWIEKKKLKELDRFIEFALGAAKMAIEDAGLTLTDQEREEAGCFVGVGMGGLDHLERVKETLMTKGPSRVSPYSIPAIIGNLAAGQISITHGLRGPNYAIASACASGSHSIGEAVEWIRRGRANVMLAGGAEATITPVGIGGFQSMFALSRRNDAPQRASRPFDVDRDGFVCGEGAGIVVLESLTRARQRGARIYGEVVGYGASSDAYHLTQPTPDGAQRAMRMALKDAHIALDTIDYINAHGTSTSVGDRNECQAIRCVFGDHAVSGRLLVSSTKSMTGHLLGAAGAIEAVFSLLTINQGVIAPTINVDNQDPVCALDVVPNTAREKRVRYAMSNSFGFGGTNATLIFSEYAQQLKESCLMPNSDRDVRLMDLAVSEGRKGRPSWGIGAPNPHVGAVLAQGDEVLAVGHHERAGEEHAEILALRQAGEAARGATMYVTLEPCNHTGRTPPCVDAILAAGIARIVVGVEDPNPNVAGGGIERLRAQGVEVTLMPEHRGAMELVAPWSKFITVGLPHVSIKLGLSLDGRIATRTGASRWVTGEEARSKVHELRAERDAVAIGIGTVLADDPRLTVREVPGPSPIRIVFDTQLRLPLLSKLASTAREVRTWVLTGPDASETLEQALSETGVNVLRVPTSTEGRIDVAAALRLIASQGVVSLFVEGGAELVGSFLAARLADELHAFIAPILLGPRGRPGAVDWAGPEIPADAPRIRLPRWELCGDDAYVRGPLEYPAPR